TNMLGKQLNTSITNLVTSMDINYEHSAISTISETTLDQRKTASEEKPSSIVCRIIARFLFFLFCKYKKP
ncbi:unnamed protein product, partial [Rotaria sp. Silwood1]